MWCAVTATVHFSAAVVFFQSASVNFSRRIVASSTFASNCSANASPLAPMNVLPGLCLRCHDERGSLKSTSAETSCSRDRRRALYWAHISPPGALIGTGVGGAIYDFTKKPGGDDAQNPADRSGRDGGSAALDWKRSGAGQADLYAPREGPDGAEGRGAGREGRCGTR